MDIRLNLNQCNFFTQVDGGLNMRTTSSDGRKEFQGFFSIKKQRGLKINNKEKCSNILL